MDLYVLYEHAAGYSLFSIKEFEEVGMLLPQVEQSVTELKRFQQIVNLVSFVPFKTAVAALENINSVSEGLLSEDLQLFLDNHFPKKKKKNVQLGVGDSKLAAAINDALSIPCTTSGAVPEIIRGIRYHFHHLIKGFTELSSSVAQLGLGHSYSRAKVKFNVHRNDNMIIQSIALLDQLDKDINTFSMRIREWYSYHFPELYKIVPENYLYAKAANIIMNRKEFTDEKMDQLEEVLMDRSKAEAILEASKSSMGMDIATIDLMNIELFAKRVVDLVDYRAKLANYLHEKMEGIAPNLSTLIGDQVGARLISHAGSLTNLAKFPASTVQILGAEKALFRALKARSTKTPKYGLLFHSTFIGRADSKNKGRISRFLANKCSIASRIDCFTENPNSVFGEELKTQVEDRLKFLATGERPEKNIDVMKRASLAAASTPVQKKKKKKKDKKRKLENGDATVESIADDNGLDTTVQNGEDDGEPKKKKKKNKKKKKQDAENEAD
uniref:Nucleolar protein 56 n=1 Tax=Lygus hesperus TaxID=30085 RepID=A0A0A9YCK6_LYGHE